MELLLRYLKKSSYAYETRKDKYVGAQWIPGASFPHPRRDRGVKRRSAFTYLRWPASLVTAKLIRHGPRKEVAKSPKSWDTTLGSPEGVIDRRDRGPSLASPQQHSRYVLVSRRLVYWDPFYLRLLKPLDIVYLQSLTTNVINISMI